jgi:hypothetical protein
VREKLAHNIGCSFLLFRTKVMGELKVTAEQKEKLDQHLRTLLAGGHAGFTEEQRRAGKIQPEGA